MGGMGGDMDGDSDEGGPSFGEDSLPEGIKKDVITEAGGDSWKKPKKGDEVTVHYVGTLESDGSEFDSSRSRDKPFVFTVGRSQVISGWDKGVLTMKKGEVAKFTLAPEFAYGKDGSPPKIPADATLVFEIELISWASKDDLFGDEGVIKTVEKEGSGWKAPKEGDEVLVALKVVAGDAVVEEKESVEFKIGSDSLGPVGKACSKALEGMKKGEESTLVCNKEYGCGEKTPDGCTVTLSLLEIFETKDVSFAKDAGMMKKQVLEGEGYETPKDGTKVKLQIDAVTDQHGAPQAGFSPTALEFVAGNGEVCDALEFAVSEMKQGEKAVLTVKDGSRAAESKLGLSGASASSPVVITMVLVELEKGQDTWDMKEEEKVEHGLKRKEAGSTLFKQGRIEMALARYKKTVDLFSYTDNFAEDNKAKANAIKLACDLNKAACYLKLKDFEEARSAAEGALKQEKNNVKALYRHAQAEIGLHNYMQAMDGIKKVLAVDVNNKEARILYKEAQAGQKEEDKKSKGLFANMCKALGKGPIPEPGRAAPIGGGFGGEDDMDDDDMEGDEVPLAGHGDGHGHGHGHSHGDEPCTGHDHGHEEGKIDEKLAGDKMDVESPPVLEEPAAAGA